MRAGSLAIANRMQSLLCLVMLATMGIGATAFGQTATVSLQLNASQVNSGQAVAGTVNITSSGSGRLDLTIDLSDNYNQVSDRYRTVVNFPGTVSVPFSLNSQYVLTFTATAKASGTIIGGGAISPSSRTVTVVPPPFDYQDYWCAVWGGGDTSSSNYWTSLAQASVNCGHLFRSNSYYGDVGTRFVRPNSDFLELKKWFQMDSLPAPAASTLVSNYKSALSGGTYYQPSARQNMIRPSSMNNAANLNALKSNVQASMLLSAKYRPVQWNIADEYGWYSFANPSDFDMGPDAISQFNTWLQAKYGTIANLNSQWNTHFTAFSDLMDPINAPRYGEAALIFTQEIRDREFPLNSGSGLTDEVYFGPWSDFRTFLDETWAAAMKMCVDTGRAIDPTIRVGFEGAESATPSSGYDYARQLHEIGSIEAYDIANSPEYIRSMRYDRYGQKIISFITMFSSGSTQRDRYALWYRLLHYGVTGAPIWSNAEFFVDLTGYALTSYATNMQPTFAEFQNGLVKLLNQGDWDDSEVALLYSQKTIQVNWMLDSEGDGKTWISRLNSYEPVNNSMFFTHVGWCKALEDIGIKGRFMSYDELANGALTSRGVKVLILPRVMAISDAEKTAIQNWVNAGGVLIADNMCGYYDGYLHRRSIANGGGWWDSFLGITRTDYSTLDVYAATGSAWSGTIAWQTPPAAFAGVTTGLTSSGLRSPEGGVRAGTGTAMGLWNGNAAQPVLIASTYGAGKIVYMNLSMYKYGFTGGSWTDERRSPSSASAVNIRQLVKNLLALGGVAPKVAVKQGWNNPTGTDVYNLEKSMRVDGAIRYLTCVTNSYQSVSSDDWGANSNTASLLFGQPGVTNANVTLSLANAANVYDVRNKQFLGYGTSINANIPVYEGAVFALLPYKVNSVSVSTQFDYLAHVTVTASVVPDSGAAGNHVLRVEVFDPTGVQVPALTQKVVATNGTWTGVVPLGGVAAAAGGTFTGAKIRVTDVATGVMTDTIMNQYAGDIDGDGYVNLSDLKLLVAAWNSFPGAGNWNPAADTDGDGLIDLNDLKALVANWNK